MSSRIITALVFERDVRRPAGFEQEFLIRRSPTSGDPPLARVWRTAEGDYRLEPCGSHAAYVNGRAIPKRPLRDGDEIVAQDVVCVFRQALHLSDLEPYPKWDLVQTSVPVDFLVEASAPMFRVLGECGLPAVKRQEVIVEDWRTVAISGPHFGFGRRRSLILDADHATGLDCSQWDVVGSGKPQFVRQRLTSIGLTGLVFKWELRRRSRDDRDPFVSESLLIGWSDPGQRQMALESLKSPFGRDLSLVPLSDGALWMSHHTDRILSLPDTPGYADHAIYSTISRI